MLRQPFPAGEYEFGLCLTHDVDRPRKGIQAPYYALRDRSLHHLRALRQGTNPWWTFDRITDIEDDVGVRSAFYFLREPHLIRERSPAQWVRPSRWIEHLGRYDPADGEIASLLRGLADSGWEIGLHGSLGTHCHAARLRAEKRALEDVLGAEVCGGRQHWLRLRVPETWRIQADLDLRYDASLGSNDRVGFQCGYYPYRPFEDFVVFPVTIMDTVLAARTNGVDEARRTCETLLREAAERNAVMTIVWHPRFFAERDFPGYGELYRHLLEFAVDRGGWVGPPGTLLEGFL